MKARSALLVLCFAGALSACASCPERAADVNAICAGVNALDGTNERVIAGLEMDLAALEARRDALLADEAALRRQAASLSGERARAARRLADLNRDTAALNARLQDLGRREETANTRYQQLVDQERELGAQLAAAESGGVTDSEIRALESRRATLESQVDVLIDSI